MENFKEPAFPTQGNAASGELDGGLSKGEYFACRAPNEIPEWFMPDSEKRPPKIRDYVWNHFGKDGNHPGRLLFMKYYKANDAVWIDKPEDGVPKSFKIEVEEWNVQREQERAAAIKYDNDWNIKRYFSWRVFYGKRMAFSMNTDPMHHSVIAERYAQSLPIDYGDLSTQAEEQIKDAVEYGLNYYHMNSQ